MRQNIIYCDHMHNYLNVSEPVVSEDSTLKKTSQFILSKDNYKGNNKNIINLLNTNKSIELIQYQCPYCNDLGRSSLIAFINEPSDNAQLTRLRRTSNGWVDDEIETPLSEIPENSIHNTSTHVIEYI